MITHKKLIEQIKLISQTRTDNAFNDYDFPSKAIQTIKYLDVLKPGYDGEYFKDTDKWVDELSHGGFIILAGGVGCGKTLYACYLAICVSLKTRTIPVYVNSYDFHNLCFENKHFQEEYLETCMVVDDMGDEYFANNEKGWGLSQWNSFFNQRYQCKSATIITTNLLAEEFRVRYGARIFDRVTESGFWINHSGDSLRKPREATNADS